MKSILKKAVIVMAVLAGVGLVVTGINAVRKPTRSKPLQAGPEQSVVAPVPSLTDVLSLVNQQRVSNGLAPLIEDTRLDTSASNKCADMVANHYWAHDSPAGVTPWVFINAQLGSSRHEGENLSLDNNTPQSAVNAWMNSPSHRANILDSKYTHEGLGVCYVNELAGSTDAYIIVQHFATE